MAVHELRWRHVVAVVGCVLALGAAPVSAAAAPSRASVPTSSSDPGQLTAEQVQAQVAKADELWRKLTAANAALASAMQQMSVLSARSNALLEKIATAREAQKRAEDAAAKARSDLIVLEVKLAEARRVVQQWAMSAYTEGETSIQMMGVIDAMRSRADRVSDPMAALTYLTDERARAMVQIQVLTEQQNQLTTAAETASLEAARATATLVTSKTELDASLAEAQATMSKVTQMQADAVAQAAPVAAYLVGSGNAKAQAAASKLREAMATVPTVTFTGGKPCSDDEGSYPNGALPASALCPLFGYPAESLRPKAAAAFNALSQAYQRQTGSPICVTDSYRTYAEQVAVKAAKGGWAATPGYSHHGLGLALDLCGGINSFGTPAHLWMQQNAPMYGWYHPSWAEPGGPLPEPWHWEFAG